MPSNLVINPTIKFTWLQEHWSQEDYEAVQLLVQAAVCILLCPISHVAYYVSISQMFEHPHALCASTPSSSSNNKQPLISHHMIVTPSALYAAQAQASEFARLNSLACSLSAPKLPSTTRDTPEVPKITQAEKKDAKWHTCAEDEGIVDAELRWYEVDGIVDEKHPDGQDFDLLQFWQVWL